MNTLSDQPLYRHSLAVMMDNQAANGAFTACPVMPDYQFSWFRDGAYIAHALVLDGSHASLFHNGIMTSQWDSAMRFHNWCAEIINCRAETLERSIARAEQGLPVVLADTLNARYGADGQPGPGDWPEFQLDGPGAWLWSLAAFVELTRLVPLPEAWEQAVITTARYLAALWSTPCYDCWEERGSDIHVSTLAAMYAGLQAAERLVPGLNVNTTACLIRDYVLAHGLTPGGELAKSVGMDMVDANLISAAVPYGLLSTADPIMQKTVARIERELHAPGSGIHRHVDDVYYGGGSWVLLALWLAWYYVEAGDIQRANDLVAWVEQQADADLNLPEQVNTHMLHPAHYGPWVEQRGAIANPLLWTHAKYVIVRRALHLTL